MHSGKNRARDLAQKSVLARRKARERARSHLAIEAPATPEDLVRKLSTAFAELRGGQLDENRARALATVGNSILKGFELTTVRKQLNEIERLLTRRGTPQLAADSP
jgi:hypothetical protein